MIIQLSSEYRIRQYDSRNWILEQWRTPKRAKSDTTDLEQPKWFNCDCYFQSIGSALKYVWEHTLIADEGSYTLQEAVEKAEKIATEMKEFAVKSVKE